MVLELDLRPVHDGPDGGTHGVTLLGCATEVAQDAFDDVCVGAFDMTPANTIGAPHVPSSFNSAAAHAALSLHLHATRTDYTLCSGCSRERKNGGRWHAPSCPVVFLTTKKLILHVLRQATRSAGKGVRERALRWQQTICFSSWRRSRRAG